VAKQGETSCLDIDERLLGCGCPSHLIIPYMVIPFDSSQFLHTPLIESISLEYISLGNCCRCIYYAHIMNYSLVDRTVGYSPLCCTGRCQSSSASLAFAMFGRLVLFKRLSTTTHDCSRCSSSDVAVMSSRDLQ